jgi:hypothetical protein
MPIITPKHLRENYQIYENKPCIDEDSVKCTGAREIWLLCNIPGKLIFAVT